MKTHTEKKTYSVPTIPIFIILLVLKLTGLVTWSWWIITLPLWIGLALWFLGLIVMAVSFLFVILVAALAD